jgi:hypothetical protein
MTPTTVTVTPGNIQSDGFKSVLKTFIYTVAGSFITILFATLYHFNFGGYEAVAMIVLPTVFKFLEKLLLPYNVTVVDPTQV